MSIRENKSKESNAAEESNSQSPVDFAAIMKLQIESMNKIPKPQSKNKADNDKSSKHAKQPEEELKSSRFRWLNEKLYTSKSSDSFEYFKENEEWFRDYHEGFKNQVKKWPKNPVDIFIKELLKEKYHSKVIADLGWGEGKLELQLKEQNPKRVIYSYDIGKMSDHVIQADISNLPLENHSLDIAIFSLLQNSIWNMTYK